MASLEKMDPVVPTQVMNRQNFVSNVLPVQKVPLERPENKEPQVAQEVLVYQEKLCLLDHQGHLGHLDNQARDR